MILLLQSYRSLKHRSNPVQPQQHRPVSHSLGRPLLRSLAQLLTLSITCSPSR